MFSISVLFLHTSFYFSSFCMSSGCVYVPDSVSFPPPCLILCQSFCLSSTFLPASFQTPLTSACVGLVSICLTQSVDVFDQCFSFFVQHCTAVINYETSNGFPLHYMSHTHTNNYTQRQCVPYSVCAFCTNWVSTEGNLLLHLHHRNCELLYYY